MSGRTPKTFNLTASHPRPNASPLGSSSATDGYLQQKSVFTPYTPLHNADPYQSNTNYGYSQKTHSSLAQPSLSKNSSGRPSAQAASEVNTTWNPRPSTPPIDNPSKLTRHSWEAHSPQKEDEGQFIDPNELLRDMGLQPLSAAHQDVKIGGCPSEQSLSETTDIPPHPNRRTPVQFAHLAGKTSEDTST